MPDWGNQVSTYKNSQPGRYFLVFPREGQWLALGDPVNRLQALPPGGVEALFPAPVPIKLTDLKATHAPPSVIFFKAVVPGTTWIIVTSLPHKKNMELTHILHRQTIITLLITVGLGGLVVAVWWLRFGVGSSWHRSNVLRAMPSASTGTIRCSNHSRLNRMMKWAT